MEEADVEAAYLRLAARLGVAPSGKRGFGGGALQVEGRIFAMLTAGRLVVKLPTSRVDALVAAARGVRFDANRGRPMKEWLRLTHADEDEWLLLALEARRFAER